MKFERPPFRGNRPNNPRGKNNAGNRPPHGNGNSNRIRTSERPMNVEPVMDVEDEEELDPPSGAMRESEYLKKLADDQTPVVVQLRNGDRFKGFVEYYDRRFIRLTRSGQPNLFLFKHDIKYLMEE